MCGIVGAVSERNVANILLEGLRRLEYRGYDSSGVATLGNGHIERRRAEWFDPYHTALAIQIERLRAIHAAIVVYDAHSIRSVVPYLFDGRLPDFNLGTASGSSYSKYFISSFCMS